MNKHHPFVGFKVLWAVFGAYKCWMLGIHDGNMKKIELGPWDLGVQLLHYARICLMCFCYDSRICMTASSKYQCLVMTQQLNARGNKSKIRLSRGHLWQCATWSVYWNNLWHTLSMVTPPVSYKDPISTTMLYRQGTQLVLYPPNKLPKRLGPKTTTSPLRELGDSPPSKGEKYNHKWKIFKPTTQGLFHAKTPISVSSVGDSIFSKCRFNFPGFPNLKRKNKPFCIYTSVIGGCPKIIQTYLMGGYSSQKVPKKELHPVTCDFHFESCLGHPDVKTTSTCEEINKNILEHRHGTKMAKKRFNQRLSLWKRKVRWDDSSFHFFLWVTITVGHLSPISPSWVLPICRNGCNQRTIHHRLGLIASGAGGLGVPLFCRCSFLNVQFLKWTTKLEALIVDEKGLSIWLIKCN